MIPVEVKEPSLRRQIYDDKVNEEILHISLDLITKLREKA